MKLVLCASAYPPDIRGGGEISTALLARGLTELGVDTTVVTFHDESVPSRRRLDGVDVLRLPCPAPYWSLHSDSAPPLAKVHWHMTQAFRRRPPQQVIDAISRLKPDLIHSSTIEDFGVGLWRWASHAGIKTAHTLRSYCLLHRGATMYDGRNDRELAPDCLSVAKRRGSRSVDGVIGISNYILRRHQENRFFGNADARVISNPVICQPVGQAAAFRSDENKVLRIGVLGRVATEKGIGPLLDVLRHVHTPHWSLEIAGKGPDQDVAKLRKRSEGLPVTFHGWRDRNEFLSGIDLLIVPSRWQEPFGRIVIESFAAGVPVVCLERGGLPELMVDGETGWVFPDWNADQLSLALSKSLQLDRSKIRAHAARYSLTKIASEHIRFYEQLTGKSDLIERSSLASVTSVAVDDRKRNAVRGPSSRRDQRKRTHV